MRIRQRAANRCNRKKLGSPVRPKAARREDQAKFWRLIAGGLSSEDATTGVGASPAVGGRWFREAGGMPPSKYSTSTPSLSGRCLSFSECEELALHLAGGPGVNAISGLTGRAASTVSRERRRNAATRSGGFEYRATTAQWRADRAVRRPRSTKPAQNAALRQYVEDQLSGQVAGPDGSVTQGPDASWTKRPSVAIVVSHITG